MNQAVILSEAKDHLERIECRKMILRFAQDDTVVRAFQFFERFMRSRQRTTADEVGMNHRPRAELGHVILSEAKDLVL